MRRPPAGAPDGHASRPAPPARAPQNGHTNGHANGARKPPVTAPVTAPPAPSPMLQVGEFAVISGGGLRRWAREIERLHGPGIAAHIAARAAKLGWPENSTRWTQEQVEDAHLDARDSLEMVYDAYRDEQPAADAGFRPDAALASTEQPQPQPSPGV